MCQKGSHVGGVLETNMAQKVAGGGPGGILGAIVVPFCPPFVQLIFWMPFWRIYGSWGKWVGGMGGGTGDLVSALGRVGQGISHA